MSTTDPRQIRVVVARPGLRSDDRGAAIVARALRDAGLEVIDAGADRTPEEIAETAVQRAAGAVVLSVLAGAHMTLVPPILELLGEGHAGDAGDAGDVAVMVAGTIPASDVDELTRRGVTAVFTPGTPADRVVDAVRGAVGARGDAVGP